MVETEVEHVVQAVVPYTTENARYVATAPLSIVTESEVEPTVETEAIVSGNGGMVSENGRMISDDRRILSGNGGMFSSSAFEDATVQAHSGSDATVQAHSGSDATVQTVSTIPQEPTSVAEALSHLGWKDEMDKKMSALTINDTTVIVPRTSDMNVVLVRLPGQPPPVVTRHLMPPWPPPIHLRTADSLVLEVIYRTEIWTSA
ncbi:hypothetical protein NE237_008734 [Protea cynaroides]|uniref:Uncharacterized protein n=1 Tax=Protea cynaroides TaxID=273540 RepID=A0A9Q0QZZ0_9MAGN|nr:hypothetical protein NE237_008734 [Protea cynaroides]